MNTYMSPGVQIPAEVIQSGGKAMHSKTHQFFQLCLEKKVASTVENVYYCAVYMVGNKIGCGN